MSRLVRFPSETVAEQLVWAAEQGTGVWHFLGDTRPSRTWVYGAVRHVPSRKGYVFADMRQAVGGPYVKEVVLAEDTGRDFGEAVRSWQKLYPCPLDMLDTLIALVNPAPSIEEIEEAPFVGEIP